MAVAELHLQAQDGYELGATLFEPAPARRAVLVMAAPAPQQYYRKFAAFRGTRTAVLTFDYRGIGRSRLRG
jgi:predicted alpha/beta hydrolase